MMKGLVEIAQGNYDKGLAFYDQAEALHKDLPALHYLRAIAYNQSNRPEKAIASAQKYIELLGEDAGAYVEIGQACEKLNRKADAVAAYKKGQADDPENAEIKEGLKRTQ